MVSHSTFKIFGLRARYSTVPFANFTIPCITLPKPRNVECKISDPKHKSLVFITQPKPKKLGCMIPNPKYESYITLITS